MSGDQPLIWVLEGERAGDNAQARELAARVGGRIESRRLRYRHRLRKVRNFLLGASLVTLDREASDPLAAPWPDLVIGVGRRSVPVARWIRKQSGGATRLVQIGRPRARLDLFDLIITTPQYGLPAAPNVIELALPITPQPPASVAEDEGWRDMLALLPEPKIAVLVGGPMKPLMMGQAEIAKLARDASALAQRLGGSLIIIGSPRTPAGLVESMAAELTVPHRVFPWTKGAPNPYRPMLRIAHQFIVTSDSVLMLTEALGTGKPVDVFRLPAEKRRRLPLRRWPFSTLVRMGLLSTKRNVDAFIVRLAAAGHVGVVGVEARGRNRLSRDDDRAVARIKALLLHHE
ncbi:MAG: mitochondrial fission ELM1 family protein [Rhizobiales bacterium]|nr:mitochondrial fission ELM1 family protein [Hyphomicrobiales bacterium]